MFQAGLGGSAASDLAKATTVAIDIVCYLGLGSSPKLRWREDPTDEDRREAEELLAEAYARTKELITNNRELVERAANALIERREVSGDELRQVARKDGEGAG